MQLSQVSTFLALSPEQRKLVYNALVTNAIEGWTATGESVALHCEFVAGTISFDGYRNWVLARLAPGSNHLPMSINCGDVVHSRTPRPGLRDLNARAAGTP